MRLFWILLAALACTNCGVIGYSAVKFNVDDRLTTIAPRRAEEGQRVYVTLHDEEKIVGSVLDNDPEHRLIRILNLDDSVEVALDYDLIEHVSAAIDDGRKAHEAAITGAKVDLLVITGIAALIYLVLSSIEDGIIY